MTSKGFTHRFCEGCDMCPKWAHDIYDCDKAYDAYYAQANDEERENI